MASPRPRCFCAAVFGTKTSLRNHATQQDHLTKWQCDCTASFLTRGLVEEHKSEKWHANGTSTPLVIDYPHKPAPNRFYCGICSNTHYRNMDDRDKHLRLAHNACPTCFQIFPSTTDRNEHQRKTTHSYCTEHDMTFARLEDLVHHACNVSHSDSYECLTCQTTFGSEGDYECHLASQRHHHDINEAAQRQQKPAFAEVQVARVEEHNLWCNECKKSFIDVTAYKQHKSSPKHKTKLIELECGCGKVYNLVSALVQHLESGGCNNGINRDRFNGIIYRYDTTRRITKAEYANRFSGSAITGCSTASIAPEDSVSTLGVSLRTLSVDSSLASRIRPRIFTPSGSDATGSLSTQSGVVLTPDGSEAGSDVSSQSGVILTPDGSEYTGTEDEFIATPSASDTSSTLSDGNIILTPSASDVISGMRTSTTGSSTSTISGDSVIFTPRGSSVGGTVEEWNFMPEYTPTASSLDGSSVATIRFDTSSKSWSCSKCLRTFSEKQDLQKHVDSGVHAPKLFHCPTSANGATPRVREFSTMSGLVQHVEGELCGENALEAIVKVIQKPLQKKMNATMKSL